MTSITATGAAVDKVAAPVLPFGSSRRTAAKRATMPQDARTAPKPGSTPAGSRKRHHGAPARENAPKTQDRYTSLQSLMVQRINQKLIKLGYAGHTISSAESITNRLPDSGLVDSR